LQTAPDAVQTFPVQQGCVGAPQVPQEPLAHVPPMPPPHVPFAAVHVEVG
jgi:hypothetical protein